MTKLNSRQARFVDEYLIDGIGAKAAMRAGYKQKHIEYQVTRLLANPDVIEAIEAKRQRLSVKCEVTAERVINEIGRIAFANLLDYVKVQSDGSAIVDLSAMTRDQAAAVQEVTVEEYMDGKGDDARPVRRTKFKLSDKHAALVTLAKHLGLLVQQHNHTFNPVESAANEFDAEIAKRAEAAITDSTVH